MINPQDSFYTQGDAKNTMSVLGVEDYSSYEGDTPQEEMDGIAILYSMAKQGKIDPWNIDIVDVADKYMVHLAQNKGSLKSTGNAIFYLAVLLKLKSNVLVGLDPLQFEQEIADAEYDDDNDSRFNEDLYEEDISSFNKNYIDDILERKRSIKLNRNRIVTLKDLIRQLEFYEELDKKQALKNSLERAKNRVRSYARLSSEEIINIAHEEYIESSVKILEANLNKIFEKEEKVELNTLTLLGLDKISAYIALLFLSAESDYSLEQEEFYSKLYVVKDKPNEGKEELSA